MAPKKLTLGQDLKRRREALGITQQHLVDLCNLVDTGYSGERTLTVDALRKYEQGRARAPGGLQTIRLTTVLECGEKMAAKLKRFEHAEDRATLIANKIKAAQERGG